MRDARGTSRTNLYVQICKIENSLKKILNVKISEALVSGNLEIRNFLKLISDDIYKKWQSLTLIAFRDFVQFWKDQQVRVTELTALINRLAK